MTLYASTETRREPSPPSRRPPDVPRRPPDDEPEIPARRRDPKWAKLCVIFGSILMVVSGLAIVGTKALTAWATGGIKQENLLGDENRPAGKSINGALNILLLGMDKRQSNNDMIRTDSIIIAHIPASHDAVYLISLPRDSRVEVPPFEATGWNGGMAKLTEAFAIGNTKNGQGDTSVEGRARGVQAMARTIDKLVPGGLKFDAVALIDYTGFEKLVAALGGVDMYVDQRVESLHFDRNGNYVGDTRKKGIPGRVYNIGYRHLDPWEALDYVRQREGLPHGDYDRQRHQQQFLFAVFKQLLSKGTLTDVTKFGALKNAAGELLTLDLGGIPVEDWIFSFKGLRSQDIVLVKTNGGTYASQRIDGKSYEIVSPTSLELLQDVHNDAVYDFLTKHPTWISKAQ